MLENSDPVFELEHFLVERMEPAENVIVSTKWKVTIDGKEQSRAFEVIFPSHFRRIGEMTIYMAYLIEGAGERLAVDES